MFKWFLPTGGNVIAARIFTARIKYALLKSHCTCNCAMSTHFPWVDLISSAKTKWVDTNNVIQYGIYHGISSISNKQWYNYTVIQWLFPGFQKRMFDFEVMPWATFLSQAGAWFGIWGIASVVLSGTPGKRSCGTVVFHPGFFCERV